MINVVMLARGRPQLTAQALDSLRWNTQGPYTLTFVADGEDPPPLWPPCSTTSLRCDGDHVLGKLKNIGVAWSSRQFGRGDCLYLSDNDVYFQAGWDRALIRALEDFPDFGVIGGQNHPYHHPIVRFPWMGLEVCECLQLAGTSMMMRWETWGAVGGFVETAAPGVCRGEDCAFCDAVRAKGLRVGMVDPPVVIDTGITNTDGEPSPGADSKPRLEGVLYV